MNHDVSARLLHKSKDPLSPRSNQERASRKSVIPAKAGIHFNQKSLDSRFRGNDGLKTAVGACGSSPLAGNLSHTLFRPENPVSCAVNVHMGRHLMQLTGQAAGASFRARRTRERTRARCSAEPDGPTVPRRYSATNPRLAGPAGPSSTPRGESGGGAFHSKGRKPFCSIPASSTFAEAGPPLTRGRRARVGKRATRAPPASPVSRGPAPGLVVEVTPAPAASGASPRVPPQGRDRRPRTSRGGRG